MGTTPVFGIRHPDGNTKAKDLGSSLRNMGLDIEDALGQASGSPMPVDTGWVGVSLETGFTGDVRYRRIGGQTWLRGQITRTAGTLPAQIAPFFLPATSSPTATQRFAISTFTAGAAQLVIYAAGAVQINIPSASRTTDRVHVDCSWQSA